MKYTPLFFSASARFKLETLLKEFKFENFTQTKVMFFFDKTNLMLVANYIKCSNIFYGGFLIKNTLLTKIGF